MPRNLSSSVSMFIEDSRVAAVANANASPVNPANFYTISNIRHTPNITPAGDSLRQYLQPQQRPVTLNIHQTSYSSGSYDRSPREIIHRIHREGEEDNTRSSSGVSSVHYQQSCQHTNDPPSCPERRRVSVSLQPMTPWVNVRGTVNNNGIVISSTTQTSPVRASAAGGYRNEDRAYTSVNLHLKSPSDSNCEYSCSTQISSPGSSSNYIRIPFQGQPGSGCCHGNCGNSVTYSTYSNFRDGFESQLQIQIGPQGGTISASRRRNSGGATARQQMNAELIAAQRERKRKLEMALEMERERLKKLKTELQALRLRCQPLSDMEQLRAQNKRLRLECEIMTEQVDMYNGSIPLGETSEEFYRDIYAGQDANSLVRHSSSRTAAPPINEAGRWPRGSGRGKPPPRPPPPRFLHLPSQQAHHPQQPPPQLLQTQSGEWCCTMCTFRNHPDLNQCEQCQMVRVPPSRCRGQNIRIRVVRHPHDEQGGHPAHIPLQAVDVSHSSDNLQNYSKEQHRRRPYGHGSLLSSRRGRSG